MTAPEVHPATADRWKDLQQVFATRGDPAGCWCQWFRQPGKEWDKATTARRREALREQVDDDPPPGVVGYLDGRPVAWCAVAPREAYPRLLRSTVLRGLPPPEHEDEDDEQPIWSVVCFVVVPEARGQGLSGAMLRAAVELARAHGARVVEGYPVDPAAREKVTSSGLYHGALSTFLAAGFREVSRPAPARPVVRLRTTGQEP